MNEDDIEAVTRQIRQEVFGDTSKLEFDEQHWIDVLFQEMAYVMQRCKTEEQAKQRASVVARNWCNGCTHSGISLLPDSDN